MRDPYNAFCIHTDARLQGAPSGPLQGLTFAAKDLFDVAGHVTGGGNPDWLAKHGPAARTAPAVQNLVDAGATMVGKTHTDELSRGIFGENAHYGTPTNPKAPGRVPGGSSSGSAAAVAGALVDFALGTDTGGSVRVPASFCGLYGIRPSHGRLPLDGVIPQAPSFDTIGWFAREPGLLARIGEVLLGIDVSRARRPRRLVVADDAFAIAEPATAAALRPWVERIGRMVGQTETRSVSSEKLATWLQHQSAFQGREAWGTFGEWVDRNNPRFSFEVADNFLRGKSIDDAAFEAARVFRAARRAEVAAWLGADTVVALPTTPFPAPIAGQPRSVMWSLRVPVITLTCIAGTLGAPQVNLPLAKVDDLPVGLSLLGAPGADDVLLGLAQAVS
ncbi:MAG: amidase [Alphaproteobacteria bacterium]|nr:amidase [Alphaproteobacteria bacterium]